MAIPDAVRAEGRVTDCLPRGRYRVELANGHRLLAWARRNAPVTPLAVGTEVILDVSPCDMTQARLISEKVVTEA